MTITDEATQAPARVTAASLRDDNRPDGRYYYQPDTGKLLRSNSNVIGQSDGSKKDIYIKWATKVAFETAFDYLGDLVRLLQDEGCTADTPAELAWLLQDDATRKVAMTFLKRKAEDRRDLKRNTGTWFHDFAEAMGIYANMPTGQGALVTPPELPAHLADGDYDGMTAREAADCMRAGYLNFMTDFAPKILATEMPVFYPEVGVAGTLDAILGFPGRRLESSGWLSACPGHTAVLTTDWKSGRPDRTHKEQLALYRRAPLCMMPDGSVVPMTRTHGTAVVRFGPQWHRFYRIEVVSAADDAQAWNTFRRAAWIVEARSAGSDKAGRVNYPLNEHGQVPSPRIADLDHEGFGRVPGALVKAGVGDLNGLTGMTAGQCLHLKGIGDKSLPLIRQMLSAYGLHLRGEAPQAGPAPAAGGITEMAA